MAVHRRLALIFAFALATLVAPSALAYTGQVASNVTVTGPLGTITCGGQGFAFAATVVDQNGNKIAGQTVTWSEVAKPLTATDTIAPPSGPTDASGVAHTTITFGPPDGSRTFRAQAGDAFGQIVVNVTGCQGGPPPVHVNVGTCQSALGLDPADGYSDGTKLQVVGRYITFRLSFGPQYAGKLIVITHSFRALPPAPPSWGSFFGATGRMADANGDVLYHFRSGVPAWISVRGFYGGSTGLDPAITTACQGRWR